MIKISFLIIQIIIDSLLMLTIIIIIVLYFMVAIIIIIIIFIKIKYIDFCISICCRKRLINIRLQIFFILYKLFDNLIFMIEICFFKINLIY